MSEVVKGLTRRDFMKYCTGAAAALGLAEICGVEKIAQALEAALKKPPVIWLTGQDCTGCSISLLSLEDPSPASLVLDKISLRYHDAIMAGAGHVAEKALQDTIKEGGYVFIFEGSIPAADDRFCLVGGRPIKQTALETAANAAAIISVGACAAYGGIPRATVSQGLPLSKVVTDKPIINLPTCPVHMDHLMGTILYYLTTHKVPPLDNIGRPKMYFGVSVHENCRRRPYFDAEMYLKDWNDPEQKDWCLLEKGCKGPDTMSDCPIRRWNNGINFCLDAGAPCQGCSEPSFYEQNSPLYAMGPVTDRILAMKAAGLIPKKKIA